MKVYRKALSARCPTDSYEIKKPVALMVYLCRGPQQCMTLNLLVKSADNRLHTGSYGLGTRVPLPRATAVDDFNIVINKC
eukprot:1745056-Rhodomonas_salina.1